MGKGATPQIAKASFKNLLKCTLFSQISTPYGSAAPLSFSF